MAYTMEDYRRDIINEGIGELSILELWEHLKRKGGVEAISVEERLKDLSPEVIEAYLKKRRANSGDDE